jgi:hypothetical protein
MGMLDGMFEPNQKDVKNKQENVNASLIDMLALNYSTDKDVGRMAATIVKALEKAGDTTPDFGGLNVEKMRKMATLAMKADPNNTEVRFRPGSRLRTYTGVRNPDGTLKDETYGGEAFIKEGTTIYRNIDPVQGENGQPIKGHFEDDGTFIEGEDGPETLFNEYATDKADHAKTKYGIDPKPGTWTEGMAQIPSYLAEIPAAKGDLEVKTSSGKMISVHGNDFVVVDALGGGKTGVQAIERNIKERTYKKWE